MTGVELAGPGAGARGSSSPAARLDRHARPLGLLAVAVFAWWAVAEGGAAPTVWYPGALGFLVALAGLTRLRRLPPTARWALAALAAYTAWSFLSVAWADARGEAWDGANRTLLYLTVLGVFCSVAWRPADVAAVLGAYVAAVSAIGTWTLIAAIADSDSAAFVDGRLAGPVGYENASAALLFGGFWIAVLLAARRDLRAPVRGLLLAAAGVLLELGILTQSRGSLIAMTAALALALWLAPERGRTATALAAVAAPATLSLPILLAVYGGGPEDERHALARAGVAIALSAAALLGAGLASGRLDRPRRPRASLLWLAAGVAVASGVMAAGLSARFTAGAESGRSDLWRVAAGQVARQPLLGAGADNFAHDYAQRRRRREEPLYPHSVEWHALGQTGLVGGTLLLGFLSAAFFAARPQRRDALRGSLALAAVVPAGYWLAHASLDWLWELPGVTAPAIACLGLAAGLRARPVAQPPGERAPTRVRTGLAGLLVAAVALSYALPALAAREVERAAGVWHRDRAAAGAALERARDINPLSARPDVVAGALAIQAGDRRAAQRAYVRAIGRDAHDWHSHAALATLDLQAGRRTAALARLRRARALNPLEPAIAAALDAAQRSAPLPPGVLERLARLAVPGPLGRRPVSCRPVLGLAAACSREEGE